MTQAENSPKLNITPFVWVFLNKHSDIGLLQKEKVQSICLFYVTTPTCNCRGTLRVGVVTQCFRPFKIPQLQFKQNATLSATSEGTC